MSPFPSSPRAKTLAFATVLFAASTVAGACSSDASVAPGQTKVAVRLTDAPFPYDSVKSVDVFVVRIDARQQPADSTTAAQNVSSDSSSSRGGWTTIATPNRLIDMAVLRNDTTSLGTTTLQSGSWSGLRMIIDPAQSSVTLNNGTTLTTGTSPTAGIVFPSAAKTGIKINLTGNTTLAPGDSTTLVVDFDLDNSFVMRGNSVARNGLLFKPVIKAVFKD
ncbi:MAG: DUF4382 domain-containing protein [Gemmatimonadaceae bacterium]